jgi:hypothetical protein
MSSLVFFFLPFSALYTSAAVPLLAEQPSKPVARSDSAAVLSATQPANMPGDPGLPAGAHTFQVQVRMILPTMKRSALCSLRKMKLMWDLRSET